MVLRGPPEVQPAALARPLPQYTPGWASLHSGLLGSGAGFFPRLLTFPLRPPAHFPPPNSSPNKTKAGQPQGQELSSGSRLIQGGDFGDKGLQPLTAELPEAAQTPAPAPPPGAAQPAALRPDLGPGSRALSLGRPDHQGKHGTSSMRGFVICSVCGLETGGGAD